MKLSGATPVDMLWEFMGYRMGAQVADLLLWNWVFVGIFALTGLLRLYWQGLEKGSYLPLAVYPLYLGFLLALLHPIEVEVGTETVWDPGGFTDDREDAEIDQGAFLSGSESYDKARTIEAPAIMALVHSASDKLLFALAGRLRGTAKGTIYEWNRIVAAAEQASILDPKLRRKFRDFLDRCYWPAITKTESDALEHLPVIGDDAFQTEEYSRGCQKMDLDLSRMLFEHLETEPIHKRIDDAYRQAISHSQDFLAEKASFGKSDARTKSFQWFYLRRIIWNETFGSAARSEIGELAKAVPEFSKYDEKWAGTSGNVISQTVMGAQGIVEAINQEGLGGMLYYRLTLFAVPLYGLILAFLILAFPLAGLLSISPGAWKALTNFFKLWLSVKLWPVYWSFLSGFNEGRLFALYPDDPRGIVGTGGVEEMAAAVAAMYGIIPILSFLIVNIAVNVTGIGISQFMSAGGSAIGSMLALTYPATFLQDQIRRFRDAREKAQNGGRGEGGNRGGGRHGGRPEGRGPRQRGQ